MLPSFEDFETEYKNASKIWRFPTDLASITDAYYKDLCSWDNGEYLDEWPSPMTNYYTTVEENVVWEKHFGLHDLPEDTLAILVQHSFEPLYVVKLTATESWKETQDGFVAYTLPVSLLQKARQTSWELLQAARAPYRNWYTLDGCYFSFYYQKDGQLKKGFKHSPNEEGSLGQLFHELRLGGY
ncbi:MAG: hypothetical protein ACRBFS_13185 [Aureispira sp.]